MESEECERGREAGNRDGGKEKIGRKRKGWRNSEGGRGRERDRKRKGHSEKENDNG